MGISNGDVYILISSSCLGSKRFLDIKICYEIKIKNIMELIKAIFPFANAEIVAAAVTCFFMVLFGLSLGFALLKVQGE